MKFEKTRKLLKEFEEMPFDYDKSIDAQAKIVDTLLGEAGNSAYSASCVVIEIVGKTHD